ncbi:MAG: hypothetical protein M3O36_17745 [Myxococcota bacterium]|nr:hypothetical protein [Myxococcota bacterium]
MTRRTAVLGVLLALAGCGTQEWSFEVDGVHAGAGDVDASLGADGGGPSEESGGDPGRDSGLSADAPFVCRSDEDCVLSTLHCDSVLGQCVACTNSLQCTQPGLPRCDFALHRCVQCGVNGDCAGDQVCEPTTEQCVFSCADGGNCPDAEPRCSEPRHVCVRCETNPDCWTSDTQRVCNPSTGQCVECTNDFDCPTGRPFCDGTTNACVGCLADVNCGRGLVCDPVAHKCLTSTR